MSSINDTLLGIDIVFKLEHSLNASLPNNYISDNNKVRRNNEYTVSLVDPKAPVD